MKKGGLIIHTLLLLLRLSVVSVESAYAKLVWGVSIEVVDVVAIL